MSDAQLPTWQRPAFEPGNQVSVGNIGPRTHGAYSARVVDPLVAQLVSDVLALDSVAWLRESAYRPAVEAWARAEAKVQTISVYLERQEEDGLLDVPKVEAALNLLARFEKQAESARTRLGLDPLSRARLGKDVAQTRAADAARVLTEMREEQEKATTHGGTDA